MAAIDGVVADGSRALPFRTGSFDLVLVVHFIPRHLIDLVGRPLRPGGHLIVETFGGQGENWRDLPERSRLRAELEPEFEILAYRERLVGPETRQAAAVKLLAQKR